jgi:hypothetical protein
MIDRDERIRESAKGIFEIGMKREKNGKTRQGSEKSGGIKIG